MKLKVLILLAGLLIPSFVFAAPGDLDPTFNGTGKLLTDTIASSLAPTNMIAVQEDGKIVAATNIFGQDGAAAIIFRYLPNGSLDTGFGDGGAVRIKRDLVSWDQLYALALDAEGKILVTGDVFAGIGQTIHHECGIARFNSDGSPDTSFNLTGTAQTAQPQNCFGTAVKADADGKIVVGGYITTQTGPSQFQFDWTAIRYNSDGSADTSFGQSGAVRIVPPGPMTTGPRALLVRPNGKVILGGNLHASGVDLGFIGFNADGTPDSGFGSGGVAILGTSMPESFIAAALQPDGKIAVVGARLGDMALARINENGSPDTSFGANGFSIISTATYGVSYQNNIILQPDGKILIGGAVNVPGGKGFAVMRFNSDGSVDAAPPLSLFGRKESALQSFWGVGGVAAAGFDGVDQFVTGMALDAAGRVVVSGDARSAVPRYFALARFQGDSSPYAGVSGTVRTAGGLPIRNAFVTLSGGSLSEPVMLLTNNLGIYHFTGLPVTETYTVTVTAKRFRFATGERALMLNADREDLDFTANQ